MEVGVMLMKKIVPLGLSIVLSVGLLILVNDRAPLKRIRLDCRNK